MQQGERLYYADFLRVSAFLLLILYHASVPFFPDMNWLIKAPQGSEVLSLIMKFPRAWRLAVIFFIAGMGTRFVFRRSQDFSFLRSRIVRLLVPLLFSMCVLIVPQVWYERLHEGGFEGSLLVFWLTRYFTEGIYPQGNFTWAHMWFVGYLLSMTVLCYPIFRVLELPGAKPVTAWFERMANGQAVYLLFLLPLTLNLALTPLFPHQTNALYNDGAWFAVWASWFGLGYLFARDHRALIGPVIARRWQSAFIALLLTQCFYLFSWTDAGGHFIGDYEHETLLFKTLLLALAWSMILTLVGFCALHFNRPGTAVAWLNRKIFPLYIIHQTIVVAVLYHVLPFDLGIWQEYALVMLATVAGSILFAIAAEFLPSPLGLFVGLNPRTPERVAMRQAIGHSADRA